MKNDNSLPISVYHAFRNRIITAAQNQTMQIIIQERAKNGIDSYIPPMVPYIPPKDWDETLPELRLKELNHILYGDFAHRSGYKGGHLYGFGWIANRPEFPKDWTPETIIQALRSKSPKKASIYTTIEERDLPTILKINCEHLHTKLSIVISVKPNSCRIITAFPTQADRTLIKS